MEWREDRVSRQEALSEELDVEEHLVVARNWPPVVSADELHGVNGAAQAGHSRKNFIAVVFALLLRLIFHLVSCGIDLLAATEEATSLE